MRTAIRRIASPVRAAPRRTVLIVVLLAAAALGAWSALRAGVLLGPAAAPPPLAAAVAGAERSARLRQLDLELAAFAQQLDAGGAEAPLHQLVSRLERRIVVLGGDDRAALAEVMGRLQTSVGRDSVAARELVAEVRARLADPSAVFEGAP